METILLVAMPPTAMALLILLVTLLLGALVFWVLTKLVWFPDIVKTVATIVLVVVLVLELIRFLLQVVPGLMSG